jgi:hypothetical protein
MSRDAIRRLERDQSELDRLSNDEISAALAAAARGRRGVLVRRDGESFVNPYGLLPDAEILRRLRAHRQKRGQLHPHVPDVDALAAEAATYRARLDAADRGDVLLTPTARANHQALIERIVERITAARAESAKDVPPPPRSGSDQGPTGGGGLLSHLPPGSA